MASVYDRQWNHITNLFSINSQKLFQSLNIENSYSISNVIRITGIPSVVFLRNSEHDVMNALNGLDHYNHLNAINEDVEENYKYLVLLRHTYQL